MIQFVPFEIALIQLLDGSIPIFKEVAVVVVLSDIKAPAVAFTPTDTLAMFLMVISRPAPTVTALGKVMVCEAVDPENTITL